jgi:hypothetical protein
VKRARRGLAGIVVLRCQAVGSLRRRRRV